jgi:prepilin peptidase CpaA
LSLDLTQVPIVIALVVAAIACLTDLRSRRIPNLLTFGAAAAAFVFHAFAAGWPGLIGSVAGWALGLALFLPLFLLRGMGAGDVKLLASFGAWLGGAAVVWIAIWSAIAGGVLAVAVALTTGYLGRALENLYGLLAHWRVAGIRPIDDLSLEHGHGPKLPYAVPLAAGLLVTLWVRS